jgi:hypothetical protein
MQTAYFFANKKITDYMQLVGADEKMETTR